MFNYLLFLHIISTISQYYCGDFSPNQIYVKKQITDFCFNYKINNFDDSPINQNSINSSNRILSSSYVGTASITASQTNFYINNQI